MATYYIQADIGDDVGGDGSQGSPWETISFAIDSINDGDTIVALPSVAEFTFPHKTITKGFTLMGLNDDASGAVFSTIGGIARWTMNFTGTIHLQKVTFSDIRSGNGYAGGVGLPVFQLNNGVIDFTLEQCIVRNIETLSSFSIGGIVSPNNNGNASSSSMTVRRCIFYDIVELLGTPASGSDESALFGNRLAASITLIVEDNTIHLPSGNQFGKLYAMQNGSATFTERGNLIKDDGGTIGHSDIHNNVVKSSYENNHNGVIDLPSFVTNDSTNITDDPFWVDEANRNYNLAPGSSAIDSRTIE